MAGVTLDAMFGRADFALQNESSDGQKLSAIEVGHLIDSPILRMMRKPDFQRETNQWSPDQIATLVGSFANGELIPSLIFWKSESYIFIIDGAHRLSALRAWIMDDYGDGPISNRFYSGEISQGQKIMAKKARNKVEKKVGRFSGLKDFDFDNPESAESYFGKLVSTVFSRGIPVQWIQGDQEVAEVSFFKINSQGTPLHKVEQFLLKNRKKSYSIAARSIVRAGTGHEYWKGFPSDIQKQVVSLSTEISKHLFEPESVRPLKTLDLPIGGNASSFDALQMILDIFRIIMEKDSFTQLVKGEPDDEDGSRTLNVLKKTKNVVRRLTGKDSSSLGLYPAVYFYNHLGRHSRFLFLGVVSAFAEAVSNRDKKFFQKFTHNRKELENILVDKKSAINQALANINSSKRIQSVSSLIKGLVDSFDTGENVDDDVILRHLGLTGKFSDLKSIVQPKEFTKETKAATLLRTSLASAPRCPICLARMDPAKGANFDHKIRKEDGGDGSIDNAQLTHPYCNSSIKN